MDKVDYKATKFGALWHGKNDPDLEGLESLHGMLGDVSGAFFSGIAERGIEPGTRIVLKLNRYWEPGSRRPFFDLAVQDAEVAKIIEEGATRGVAPGRVDMDEETF